jgi:beta propeller repeat protein
MSPMEPPGDSLFSKIMVVGALALLLVIIGACGYVIYGFVNQPPDPDAVAITATIMPPPTSSPMLTPIPTMQPSGQISPTPKATPTPVYQDDLQITKGIKVVTPGIWGTFVVYDENVGTDNYRIHLYNTVSRIDDVIATGNVRSYGCIGSGKVGLLYGDDYRIMLYDLEEHNETQATPRNKIPRMYPSIFANRLIYTGNDGAYNPAIGWLDIFSLYEFEIADNNYNLWANPSLEPNEPRGYGSYVVWWQINGNGRDIVLFRHDSRPCMSKIISPAGASSDHPRIYGNTVVFHSIVGGTDHIYFYDIPGGFTKKITDLGKQYYADVYENNIVYDDNRENNWNIYVYDRTNGQERQLTSEPHDQMMPQFYGNNIIYMDNRNYGSNDQGWDLYILQI